MVVTQRATQLYAQSLRGDSKKEAPNEEEGHVDEKTEVTSNFPVPLWLMTAGGGSVITAIPQGGCQGHRILG
jgi:membrane fusion protein, heavy metal efflux system